MSLLVLACHCDHENDYRSKVQYFTSCPENSRKWEFTTPHHQPAVSQSLFHQRCLGSCRIHNNVAARPRRPVSTETCEDSSKLTSTDLYFVFAGVHILQPSLSSCMCVYFTCLQVCDGLWAAEWIWPEKQYLVIRSLSFWVHFLASILLTSSSQHNFYLYSDMHCLEDYFVVFVNFIFALTFFIASLYFCIWLLFYVVTLFSVHPCFSLSFSSLRTYGPV